MLPPGPSTTSIMSVEGMTVPAAPPPPPPEHPKAAALRTKFAALASVMAGGQNRHGSVDALFNMGKKRQARGSRQGKVASSLYKLILPSLTNVSLIGGTERPLSRLPASLKTSSAPPSLSPSTRALAPAPTKPRKPAPPAVVKKEQGPTKPIPVNPCIGPCAYQTS